jgi:hypothetical protein
VPRAARRRFATPADLARLAAVPPPKKPTTLAGSMVAGARPAPKASVAEKKRDDARKQIASAKEAKRQKVWDKLDAARRAAAAKLERLDRFKPGGATKDAARDDDFEL